MMQRHAADALRQPVCLGKLSTRCLPPSGHFHRSRASASTSSTQQNALKRLQPLQWTPLAVKGASYNRRQRLVCCKLSDLANLVVLEIKVASHRCTIIILSYDDVQIKSACGKKKSSSCQDYIGSSCPNTFDTVYYAAS